MSYERKSFQAPEGKQFEYTEESSESIQETVRELTTEEQDKLILQMQRLPQLLDRYVKDDSLHGIHPIVLDLVFANWLEDESPSRPAKEAIANILGACFGHYLCQTSNFDWVQVTNEIGMDWAIRHPVGNIIIYPFGAVQKRLETEGTGFF